MLETEPAVHSPLTLLPFLIPSRDGYLRTQEGGPS